MPLRSLSLPGSTSTSREPPLRSNTGLTAQSAELQSPFSYLFIHAQWTTGLMEYSDFRLHKALSTFKRLLVHLRSVNDKFSNPTAGSEPDGKTTAYQILPPQDIALLYINIALIHGYLGSYYLCAAAFEEALRLDDSSAVAWFGLGIARFYLKELRASKRAFGKCQICFVAQNASGRIFQKDSLTYEIWIGRPLLEHASAFKEDHDDPGSAPSPWQPLQGIFSHTSSHGKWELDRQRVEWNWRIAVFERNHTKKGVERPAGGKWGLNGIPAGVIFGLPSHSGTRIGTTNSVADDKFIGKGSEDVIDDKARGRASALVKQKWNHLQQKVLRRSNAMNSSPLQRRTRSLEPPALSFQSVVDDVLRAKREMSRRSPGVSDRLTQPRALSLDQIQISRKEARTGPPTAVTPNSTLRYPPRRSSLRLPSARSFSRSSRGSILTMNDAIQDIGRIEEDPMEDQFTDPWVTQPVASNIVSRELEEISPTDTREPDIAGPDSLPETRRFRYGAPSTLLFHNRTFLPVIELPPAPAISEDRRESFMTDSISSLSSYTRSRMFPSISDQSSSSSERRPSYATDVWSAGSGTGETEDDPRRRLSPIVTFSPAVSERRNDAVVSTEGPLPDWNGLGLSSTGLTFSPILRYEEDMTVEPLNVWKKNRLTIMGRSCLSEWEWEAEYERWQQEGVTSEDADEDDDTIGEILLPRRFEG
ncbi:MAG: hypothetical protein Q9219_001318 [cf. Caloplaca sp. 3 TL-2023]